MLAGEQESDDGGVSVKFKCYKFCLLRSFIMYEDKKGLRRSLPRQQNSEQGRLSPPWVVEANPPSPSLPKPPMVHVGDHGMIYMHYTYH